MNPKINTSFAIALAFGIVFAAPVAANTPAEKGFEVAARSDRTDLGFGDSRVELQMILQNAAASNPRARLRSRRWKNPTRASATRAWCCSTPRVT